MILTFFPPGGFQFTPEKTKIGFRSRDSTLNPYIWIQLMTNIEHLSLISRRTEAQVKPFHSFCALVLHVTLILLKWFTLGSSSLLLPSHAESDGACLGKKHLELCICPLFPELPSMLCSQTIDLYVIGWYQDIFLNVKVYFKAACSHYELTVRRKSSQRSYIFMWYI